MTPILDGDDTVGVFGDVVFVGHEDDGVALGMQTVEQRHEFNTCLRVEIAGGFVGQDDGRAVHQGAGNGYALPLASGKLVRLVVHARFHCPRKSARPWLARYVPSRGCRVNQRQLAVVQRGGAGEQVECLEHESDFFVPNAGKLVIGQLTDALLIQPVLASGRGIQAADQVHQCGFSGARRSHDGKRTRLRSMRRFTPRSACTCSEPIS